MILLVIDKRIEANAGSHSHKHTILCTTLREKWFWTSGEKNEIYFVQFMYMAKYHHIEK
jgi:hypothetical protein